MTPGGLTRRRVLAVLAVSAAALRGRIAFAETPLVHWRGRAFGADVSLSVRDADTPRAQAALRDGAREIERLETVLSLYRPDSALARLNAAGGLDDPPAELLEVLTAAAQISAISGGAFDVTVQPLWGVHVRAQRDPRGFGAALDVARGRIGWQRLSVAADRIAFAAPGMAATLNGIAQGYAADRIASLLHDRGCRHVLADLGETRAVGERAPGEAWRIGVGRPEGDDIAAVLRLSDAAVATSSPAGFRFDATGERHHLFDPRTGRSARSWAQVSVVAADATTADALSTAIAVAPMEAAETLLAAGGGREALLIDDQGRLRRIRA
ncbi:MAG TPA: FAD:protein FMN transferase [Rhodospirillales bacterium]|nr:FAD:protein FMN transferase [Rhodospirillales bacterium]